MGKSDIERRIIINSIGPTWEGNQTWFITAGGAMFAAWPLVYAAAFFRLLHRVDAGAVRIVFFRPVGFDYRGKIADPRWRSAWDWGLFVGGFVPPLIFGVAFGNLLLGVPFHYDNTMRMEYTGNFFGLLNPFGLLAGVVSVAMLVMHGAAFLQVKTEGVLAGRARKAATGAALLLVVAFILAGLWVAIGIDGYRIVTMPDSNSAFMPVAKTVERVSGAWLDNYHRWPLTWVLPLLAIGGALLCILFSALQRALAAFFWPAARQLPA
ncbi:cytochrome d ubiquinol oxidase subunit II [Undibacterium arcticum]